MHKALEPYKLLATNQIIWMTTIRAYRSHFLGSLFV